MTSRLGKMAVVLLLGLILAWQGVFLAAANGPEAAGARPRCCRPNAQCADCGSTACCAKPADNRAPAAPAPPRSASGNETHAVPSAPITLLTLLGSPLDAPTPPPLSI